MISLEEAFGLVVHRDHCLLIVRSPHEVVRLLHRNIAEQIEDLQTSYG